MGGSWFVIDFNYWRQTQVLVLVLALTLTLTLTPDEHRRHSFFFHSLLVSLF